MLLLVCLPASLSGAAWEEGHALQGGGSGLPGAWEGDGHGLPGV